MLCASLCCSSVMAAEKDASEAIRSVVATLPNIHKLKAEQEQVLPSFVGGHDVVDHLLPTGFGNSLIFPATEASSVTVGLTLVVKELAKANASVWSWQIRVALSRSNRFGSQRLSMEQAQTLCTN